MYKKRMAAEVRLDARPLQEGDTIMVQGPTTGVVTQKVVSLEIDHKKVAAAPKGALVGVQLRTAVRKNDLVYRVVPRRTQKCTE